MRNCWQESFESGRARKAALVARVLLAALAVALAASAGAQTAGNSRPPGHDLLAKAEPAPSTAQPPDDEIYREIDDANTGDRWLLSQDGANPAGPGRMVRIESPASSLKGGTSRDPAQLAAAAGHAARLQPVIHAGDALLVEEHTAVADAWLEALALANAVVGAEFKARLRIGGKVVRVVAVAKGRAILAPESETQP